ncbi:hypothetical protein MTsPCn9_09810 [Croceitalea sp. MTPC9]|uniref:hypothetical protein n=1 Tax=unclassified Croceitalea TaxID=2632280 RepID=UPI002B3991A0|nr:hypothetical protein MTsPCn6_27430 [Croceitalea sp. MTPC6]GMN16045.1 hypothetical protein MTsPCn9_09810 [Croceitalea sp. MTPC9]
MKKNLLLRNLIIVFSTIIIFISCQKEDDFINNENVDSVIEEEIFLQGEMLKNPYEISNIRQAYLKVLGEIEQGDVKTGKGFKMTSKGDTTQIEPNYLYVRFDPKNTRQEQRLKEKKRFTVVDYPLEYENPNDYRKTIKRDEDEISSYWTSVPIGKKLPKNIPYVILQEMYIPEKDPKYDNKKGGNDATKRGEVNDEIDFMNHLLEEAYAATDNEDLLPDPPIDKKGETCETCFLGINLRAKWNPSGNIQIWDDHVGTTSRTVRDCRDEVSYDYTPCYNGDYANCPRTVTTTVCTNRTVQENGSYIPLVGAQVLIRDTWTLGNAITDNNGDYRFSSVRAKVKYLIQWERYQYSVRDNGGLFQAEDKGPKLYKQAWNYQIRGGRMEYRANIHRAAHNYYYGNINGLRRPPNNFTNRQTKIRARETCCDGVNEFYLPYLTGGIWPTITIKEYRAPSRDVFSTTTHEIAHSTHAANSVINFPLATKRHRESYAEFIETIITNRYYQNLTGNPNFEINGFRQGFTRAEENVYTSFFIDLWDDFNQRTRLGDNALPNDLVEGYTFRQIEDAVFKRTDYSGVVRELQKLNNPTENRLWELRNHWGSK